jgi:CheY-like chemotaxis protein
MKILIVDNHPETLKLCAETIQNAYPMAEITCMSSGYDAFRIQRNSYDVVMTEVFLPDLRADLFINFINYPCFKIGVSNYATLEIRRKFDAFLLRPFPKEEISRVITNAFFQFINRWN